LTRIRLLLLLLILCLFLLLGTFLLQYEAPVEAEVSIPITYANLPSDLIISGQPIKEVEVRVTGQKTVLEVFAEQKHTCTLDLAHAAAGLVTLTMDESTLRLPTAISIVHMEPTSVTLRVEPKQIKTVPVVVTLADSPAPGYRVALTLASPSTMQIIGSEKSLEPIDRLVTRPVSIKDASESFKKEIAVDLPSGVSVGNTGTSLVTAQINIEENVVTHRFENIPVEGRNTVFTVKISPPEISIDIRGPENEVTSLSVGDDITVYVDLTDLSPGVYVRRAQIPLSGGITAVAWDPEVFTVTIGD
jgi:YbbR domain-containing protein